MANSGDPGGFGLSLRTFDNHPTIWHSGRINGFTAETMCSLRLCRSSTHKFEAANPDTVEMTAHPSITGWKTAPRASGADAAASVLFHDSGGIVLSGVAELGVFSIQMEIRPKRNVATRLLA
jgi:hypothetical protein